MAISHQENDDWLAGYEEAEEPLAVSKAKEGEISGMYRAVSVASGAPLLIVHSEEAATAAASLFVGCAVVTWAGPVAKARWDTIRARENMHAILLPANSPESQNDMDMVAGEITRYGYSAEMISVAHMPDGWSITETDGWSSNDAKRFYDENKSDFFVDQPVVIPAVRAPQRDQGSSEHEDPFGADILPLDIPENLKSEARKLLVDAKRDDTTRKMGVDGWQGLGVEMAHGKPIPNVSNASIILGRAYHDMVWYDSFLSRIRTWDADHVETRDWTDADDIRITIELQRVYGMAKVSRDIVHQAIVEHAYRNVKNELIDFLKALEPWDGIDRAEMFFIECAGARDTPYARAVGRNFWTGLAARAIKPGCKLDTMVILEGKQGKSKSTLLEVIGGRWYAIMAAAPDSNDFAATLAGKWVIEVAELQSFSKADENSVKRTLRTASDRYRPPYGRHAVDHPRSSILAGSTNRDDYNMDSTGFRHGWPIACGDIRLDLARQNRNQLIAEAIHRFNAGATWWEMPTKETEMQQLQRYAGDPWESKVLHIVSAHTVITIPQIMTEMHLSNMEQSRASQMRIGGILKVAGWEKVTEWDSQVKTAVRRWKREAAGT